MKDSIFIAFILVFIAGGAFAQQLQKKITIAIKESSVEEVLEIIRKDYDVPFSYINNELPESKITVDYQNQSLEHIMEDLLQDSELEFVEYDGQIIIKKNLKKKKPAEQHPVASNKPDPIVEQKEDVQQEAPMDTIEVSRTAAEQEVQEVETIKENTDQSYQENTYYDRSERKLEHFFDTDYNPEEYIYRDIHYGVFYPVSSNGVEAGRYVNRMSFHLLAGFSAGLDGFEMSLLGNVEKDFVKGFQFGGLANVVGREVDGGQFAGLANVVGGHTKGFQFAGIANVIDGDFNGFQAAGIANVVDGEIDGMMASGLVNVNESNVNGFQLAGFANISGGMARAGQVAGFMNLNGEGGGSQIAGFGNFAPRGLVQGVQVAGFINEASYIKGTQLAGFINVADNIKGFQGAGFINVARNVKGVQLGVINIADSLDGIPIGLLSIVNKNGYFDLELFYADDFEANAIVKVGVQKFHNLFGISMENVAYEKGEINRWALGYGFGSQWGKRTLRLNTDLMAYHVFERNIDDKPFTEYDLNLLSKFRALASIHFNNVGIFGGPVLNVMVSQHRDPESNTIGSQLVTDTFYNKTFDDKTNVKMWIGYNLGIRF